MNPNTAKWIEICRGCFVHSSWPLQRGTAQAKHYKMTPTWNFLYKIATVELGKMVRFRAILCQRLQFSRGPWCQ